ncbi:DUF4040 domain-containing protein [Candidatus Anaplasma sp. TIGMIC]|uniref:DUF4040 domain-containing protein n=1 Tax=Candidatus Anaplasma sp. TIGMIC TaxID=3020713 RepID=UPI0023306330|nr:DUF4040 domain-containing protein [Candidatus Anaplasma sp. TIGMIC]MDB1135022.1 DUF4040 domain-containing protein [Candidatus Anaplasma sp. TIGMIC]
MLTTVVDFVLLLFLVVSACAVAFSENLLVNTIVMCAFSTTMATLYLVMNAPDVAITEAAVGAGFSTVLMLLVLSYLGHGWKISGSADIFGGGAGLKLVTAGTCALLMFFSLIPVVLDLPVYGDAGSPANIAARVSYTSNTYSFIGIPNLVTAVLASFRGYDTLCETVVVFTAAISVSLLIGRNYRSP